MLLACGVQCDRHLDIEHEHFVSSKARACGDVTGIDQTSKVADHN